MNSFEFTCMIHGANLAEIDDMISRLAAEKAPAAEELKEHRQKAFEAHKQNKYAFLWHLERITARIREIKVAEQASPLIAQALLARDGYKSRQVALEREEVRGYARFHWQKFPNDTVAAVLRIPSIEQFIRENRKGGHRKKRTVHDWIKDLKPGGTKAGRPKKK